MRRVPIRIRLQSAGLLFLILTVVSGCYTSGVGSRAARQANDRTHALGMLQPGRQVRVNAPNVFPSKPVFYGTIIQVEADTLSARGTPLPDAPMQVVEIPLKRVEQLSVMTGPESKARRALLGAAIGFAVVKGGICMLGKASPGSDAQAGLEGLFGTVWGVLVGAPAGALVGLLTAPARWKSVPLRNLQGAKI